MRRSERRQFMKDQTAILRESLWNWLGDQVIAHNVFCPTGAGGGVDPSCAPGGPGVWKSAGGFEHTGITWKQPTDANGRPIPIKVVNVEQAAVLVMEGKVVEVPTVKVAHTLIN